jgi:hypothetical protein
MRKLNFGALAIAGAVLVSACQRPVEVWSEPATAAVPAEVVLAQTDPVQVPAGTMIQASLDQQLSTGETNVNDTFTLSLETPIMNVNRRTIIPAGARITGRVTAVRQSLAVATPAILRLEFNELQWADRRVPINAEITATEVRREGRTADDALRGAAAGAAAGAVIGTIIRRDIRGALTGAAIGAGAGTVVSLGTSQQDAVLDAGTTMTLRLTDPLPLR